MNSKTPIAESIHPQLIGQVLTGLKTIACLEFLNFASFSSSCLKWEASNQPCNACSPTNALLNTFWTKYEVYSNTVAVTVRLEMQPAR